MNFHKQKLYSLIGAGLALIALVLPWISFSMLGMSSSQNGFRGWGILTLLGVLAVAGASLLNDKTQDFDATMKKVVLGGFGAIGLGALLFYFRKNTAGGGILSDVVSAGAGLWIALAVGVAGVLFHLGIIKIPNK